MGVHANVGFNVDHFPKQGKHLGKQVRVCFNYATNRQLQGLVVRDDIEDPYRCFIQLEDGRYIEASECQYTIDA